jgi:hypothetical protein
MFGAIYTVTLRNGEFQFVSEYEYRPRDVTSTVATD